jgi:hypothetical protein
MSAKSQDRRQPGKRSAVATKPDRPRDNHTPVTSKASTLRGEHGVGVDTRGQDQPTDKKRAQQTTEGEESGATREHPPHPGQPAGGE